MTDKTAFKVRSGLVPLYEHGPKYLPIDLDFTDVTFIDVNLFNENTNGAIDFVQSLYIDNASNPDALVIVMNVTGQRLVIPPYSQGTYPCLASTPLQFRVSTTQGALNCMVGCLNVPMPFAAWFSQFAGPLNVATPPYVGAYIDRSGSVAIANTPQVLAAANPTRKQIIIRNPAINNESLFINFGAAPDPNVDALEITVGSEYNSLNGPVTNQEIQIVSVGAGVVFIAKEM